MQAKKISEHKNTNDILQNQIPVLLIKTKKVFL
jgi:hypothetical protein